jgi:hypothetical protein
MTDDAASEAGCRTLRMNWTKRCGQSLPPVWRKWLYEARVL